MQFERYARKQLGLACRCGCSYEEQLKSLIAFVKKRTQAGNLPTFEETAKKFNLTYRQIEDMIDDTDESLQLIAGIGIGGGMYAFKTKGEYQIEWQEKT